MLVTDFCCVFLRVHQCFNTAFRTSRKWRVKTLHALITREIRAGPTATFRAKARSMPLPIFTPSPATLSSGAGLSLMGTRHHQESVLPSPGARLLPCALLEAHHCRSVCAIVKRKESAPAHSRFASAVSRPSGTERGINAPRRLGASTSDRWSRCNHHSLPTDGF